MRDILFRDKRIDDGEWVYGSYLRRTHPCIEYFGTSFGFFDEGKFCANIFWYGFYSIVIGNIHDNPELLEGRQ